MICTSEDLVEAGAALLRIGSTRADVNEITERIFKAAVEINPENSHALHNLGTMHNAMQRPLAASKSLAKAVALSPSDGRSWSGLATSYIKLARFKDALQCGERAVELNPDQSPIWHQLAGVYELYGDFQKAEEAYSKALAIDNSNETAYAWGMTKMLRGDWRYGLPLYERRLKDPRVQQQPVMTAPECSAVNRDKTDTIIVDREQGVGDIFQMSRYVEMLHKHYPNAKVVLRCEDALIPIMRRFLYDEIVPKSQEINVAGNRDNIFISSMSLMYLAVLLGEDIYYPVGLAPLDEEPEPWIRDRLRIGLCWSGNPRHPMNKYRSMTDVQVKPLLRAVKKLDWINLQLGEVRADLSLDKPDVSDWEKTLSVMRSCDLVICVDTWAAHMAGCIKKPVWMMLAKTSDWRWHLEYDTTRWYPTMRIFRQTELLKWEDVIEKVRDQLKAVYPENF